MPACAKNLTGKITLLQAFLDRNMSEHTYLGDFWRRCFRIVRQSPVVQRAAISSAWRAASVITAATSFGWDS
jgi:hypothetical protein